MDVIQTGDDRYALRRRRGDSVKQMVKGCLGSVLMVLFPSRAEALRESDFTHANRRASLLSRFIGAGIAYRALRRTDFSRLAEYHRRFWGGERAKAYHDEAPERFRAVFLRYYTPLVDALEECLASRGGKATFCEIGCGAGLLIDYLARRFEGAAERLIGLDLDPVTIAMAQERFTDPRMEFIAGDALAYIEEHGQPNWVYVTQNGVLEYFEPSAVERLFKQIASLKPAVVALIEPLGMDHDLESQPESWPYGQEFSFSHNYPHLLEKSGFQTLYRQEVLNFGVRFIMILAVMT